MFDIGFGEIVLVLIIGLIVLGPERLPVAVKTVAGWIRAMRSLASSVQNELTQELKLQELKESLKKAEQAGLQNLSPELKASMEELKEMASGMKRTVQSDLNKAAESLNETPASGASATSSASSDEEPPRVVSDPALNRQSVPPVDSMAKPQTEAVEDVPPSTGVEPKPEDAVPETVSPSLSKTDGEK
ncbi:Sec-independent protein translocase protein TatB [Leminorella richardii]|uniref:Sec-independent protein translocase protein TatB n=1 Tax=Leminorella richardii TaxID=158841 RepID=A0A2X4UIT4_9GAMM|nr:Sec-independent protein translocase protein TatB [Leminorella richardii]SQI34492.1 Sec-independent protein translocase protein TatB [Leminorella richardii]